MADHQIHPYNSPPQTAAPAPDKPAPPAGTYVIQIPKDQIYRVPPPENAERFERLSRRKPRRSSCRRCLLWSISAAAIAAFLLAVAAGAFYLAVRPENPTYSVEGLSFSGVNLTSPGPISPAASLSVRARNGNDKIGIEYGSNSDVTLRYGDVTLCDGVLPSFYQPPNNVTVIQTALSGAELVLSETVRFGMEEEVRKGHVAVGVRIRAPVRIRMGSVRTWQIAVKVDCELTVDKLTAGARVVKQDCGYGVDLW